MHSNDKRTYRVGIIGCGRIAGLLEDDMLREHPCTHMGAYQQVSRVEVVACCSKQKQHARAFAKRFSIPRFYSDYHEMLNKEELDIVSIATYAPSHCEIVCAAARAGVKGIFCEKAMATSLAEADLMIDTCKKQGVKLSINHTRRWGADYAVAKKMIKKGVIGTLQSLNGTFSGNLLHTGIHLFDLLIYFAGAPQYVWGTLTGVHTLSRISSGYKYEQNHIEDQDGVVTVQFKKNVYAQVLGLSKKYFIFELDIQGTEGRIRMGNNLFQCWKNAPSTHYEQFHELKPVAPFPAKRQQPALVLAIEDLISAIEKNRDTQCSGNEARKSLELAFAVYASDSAGASAIKLPVTNRTTKVLSR